MSESTPVNNPPRRRVSRWWWLSLMPLCWLLSAIFHGGLLAWLTWFAPGALITPRAHRAESTAGSERIREVMNAVRERQADHIKERVRELQDIQTQLTAIETNKLAEYRAFAEQFTAEAPAKAMRAQAEAVQALGEVMAAQTDAQHAVGKIGQEHATNGFAVAETAQKKVMEVQGRLDRLQEVALQTVMMGGNGMAPAAQAQTEANSLQSKADMAQVSAGQVREAAQEAHHQARKKQSAAEKAAQQVERDAASVAAVKSNAITAVARAAEARADANEAQTAATQAKADAEKPGLASKERRTALSKLSSVQSKAKFAATKAGQLETTAAKLQTAAEQAPAKLAQSKSKAAQAKTDAEAAAAQVAAAEAAMVQSQTQARQVQAEARQAQAKAQQALAAAIQTPGGTPGGPPMPASVPFVIVPASTGDVNDMNLAELYQAAVTTETTLTETYRAIRAMELSLIRQIPLEQAMKLTDVAKALRPDLAGQLKGDVTSGDGVFPGARQAAQAAASEVNSMLSLGNSMLTIARGQGSGGPEGATVAMASYSARANQAQMMEELAAEDPNARAKDLSGAMRAGFGTGEGGGGRGGGAGGAGGAAAGGAGAGGRGGGAGGAGMAGGGTGVGGGAGFGAGAPGGLGRGYGEIVPIRPPKISKDAATRALPTRKIKHGGLPGEWMFVDSWYVVGPWDNRGRVNIDKKFPPETVVDLDATYVGKDGKPIQWEFVQTPTPRITPTFPHFDAYPGWEHRGDFWEARALDYIIYYAYTTLFFDQEQDLWVAIGSDDFSKIWVDDQLIWASGKEHKPWSIDEGYRKVHFHKGLNRILYRVENGQHATDFSLVICLKRDSGVE